MVIAGRSASLALLISFAFGVTDAIRALKDGPMIDAEGREYKTAILKTDAENLSGPRFNDGSPVRVRCTEVSMVIVVKADLYNNGRILSPGELFLGEVEHPQSNRCRAVAAGDHEYVIEAGLQDCGSKLTISEDFVIYSNKLIISPAAGYHGITRVTRAVVPVSCHYKRYSCDVRSAGPVHSSALLCFCAVTPVCFSKLLTVIYCRTHLVSSTNAQRSPPALSTPATAAFSLKLMTDDWTRETLSRVFYTGDLLHLEASYSGPDSGQRRLFIDSCVATLSPDAASVPRYYFIENRGCLADAKEEGSKALFKPRTRASSLRLQLDAFLFHQDSRNSIFITCQLKATSELWTSSSVNKACNYVHSRWMNVDGSDVCRCCDGTCDKSSPNLRRRLAKDITSCGTVTLGPLMVFPNK